MTTSRCYDHKDSKTLPLACPTCMRIHVEHAIGKKAVTALLAAGYALLVNDGDSLRPEKPTTSPTAILAELAETDHDILEVFDKHDEDFPFGYVTFVYGNSGWDVISDYSTNLEEVLTPVNAYAATMGG